MKEEPFWGQDIDFEMMRRQLRMRLRLEASLGRFGAKVDRPRDRLDSIQLDSIGFGVFDPQLVYVREFGVQRRCVDIFCGLLLADIITRSASMHRPDIAKHHALRV